MAKKKKYYSSKPKKGMFGYEMPKDVIMKEYPMNDYFMGSYEDTMEYTDRVHNENVRKLRKMKSDKRY